MKKLIIILNILWVAAVCYATPVDVQRAQKTAQKVLGGMVTLQTATTQEVKGRGNADAPAYYVFAREGEKGFAIISGESSLPAVVAYSDHADFSVADDMPPALADFLHAYTAMVDDIRNGEEVMHSPLRAEEEEEHIPVMGPFCPSQWDQGDPYNKLCPAEGKKKCPAGCVAIAMAQIMKHHEWPLTGKGKVYYTPESLPSAGLQYVDFSESHYDWSIMHNTTAELKADETAGNAVAKLCYDCGVSSRMQYSATGSGTYDDFAIQSMYENFCYKASTIRIVYRDCYATQEEWETIWKAELDAGRPVLYSGQSTSGGHEFVVDGYDTKGFVHVNWGWGGKSDGYFDIAILDATASQQYSARQGMIIGMEPDREGTDVVPAPIAPYIESPFNLKGTLALGKDKLVMLSNVYNRSRSGRTWTMGVGLYDLDGNFIQSLTVKETPITIDAMRGVGTTNVRFNIPTDTPEGSYILSSIAKAKGYDYWIVPNVVGGAIKNKVFVEIANGVATFGQIPDGINTPQSASDVVSHEYFDLSGRKLQTATKGIVIDRQTLSNGKQIIKKVRL